MELWRLLYPLRTYLIVSGTLEKPNVMTADWVIPLSFQPELIGICIGKKRYTYELIKRGKEFVIAVPDFKLLKDVWIAGTRSGRSVDKRELLSLTFTKSKKVKVPSIGECLANIECRVVREVEIGDHVLFVGEVVDASFKEEAFRGGKANVEAIDFLLHVANNEFTSNRRKSELV